MAKQKGLTLEDLMKSREAMKKEDISEGATGMRSIAAAISPSLTPIAQSLGKLQQISDPKAVQGGSSVRSSDTSISRDIKQTSDSLKTLVTLNRTLNSSIERVNKTLVDQLDYIKLVERRQSKQDEETYELLKRASGEVSTDRAVVRDTRVDNTEESARQAAMSGTEQDKGTAKPGSRLGRIARVAAGAAVGGAAGAALYGIAPQELRDLLANVGIGEKAAGTIGAVIGAAVTSGLPFKEMAAAALSVVKELGSLASAIGPLVLKFGPLLAAVGAASYGLYKLNEYIAGLSEEERQSAAAAADLIAAQDSATATQKIEEYVTSEQGKKAALTREQQAATIKRMGGSVWRALDMGGMLGGGTAADFVRKEEEMVEASRARGLAGAGREITLPTQPQFITPYTDEITPERAQEIFRGTPPLWKKMTPEKRSEFLVAARSRGVMDINPDLTRSVNTGFVSGSLRASEAEMPSVETNTPQPALNNRLGMFNAASTEAGRNAAVPAAPTIIRGGDTINNVNNVSGGGGSGGAGSPSMPFNPWSDIQIGRQWAPYPSGWR